MNGTSATVPRVRRAVLLAVLASTAIAALFVGSTASAVSATPVNGHIFYESDDAHEWDVDSIAAGGTHQRITTLVPGGVADRQGAVSPDGTRVAFQSDRGGSSDLYVMNADGSNVVQLTHDTTADVEPAWSPDGTKIAWASRFDGDYDITVINVDGTGRQNVTPHLGGDDLAPTWAPDSKRVAFQSWNGTTWDIDYATLGEPEIRNGVVSKEHHEEQPDWSPDGTRIAYITGISESIQVWVYDITTGKGTQLTHSAGMSIWPRWSPDGKQIAFSSNRDGDMEVFTMNADGSNQTQLTHNTATDNVADWQPLLDTTLPTAKALPAKGRAGKTLHLRYRSSDDSGRSSIELDVLYKGSVFPYRFVQLTSKPTGNIPFPTSKTFKGTLRFCIRAFDPSANESPQSCAAIKVTPPPKPKPKHKPRHKPH
jgi:dipeptidyl aminopeptidase/acylaminoacyl peptidase